MSIEYQLIWKGKFGHEKYSNMYMYAWIFHILEDFHIIYHITCKNQSDLKINKVGFFLKYFFLLDCLTKKPQKLATEIKQQ